MTDSTTTKNQWETDASRWPEAILELRARVEAMEDKYDTMRLATLEWGKDVETLQLRSDRHLQRIEALESAENALRAARRGWPLSLKEQALQALAELAAECYGNTDQSDTIRRALEKLDD